MQQQGHRAAGQSLLPSLARSWWERDQALINRDQPGRGDTGAGLPLASAERDGGKGKVQKLLQVYPLSWISLQLPGN